MAARLSVGVPMKGSKTTPTPSMRPSFVLGSRPASMRTGAVPTPGARIKPAAASTTQYGKMNGQSNPANVAGQWPGAGNV